MSESPISLEKFSGLLEGFYDAALDAKHWEGVLLELADLFAGNYATLILRLPEARDPGLLMVAGDPANSFFSPYYLSSPFAALAPDKVVLLQDLMPESRWRQLPYYQLWCAPHNVFHVMAADIRTASGIVFRLRITRPETAPPFSETDRALCAQLLPHLRRALFIHTQYGNREHLNNLYAQAIGKLAVGAIILDENGFILQQNPAAELLLRGADGFRLVRGRLEAFYPNENAELQRLIRTAFAKPSNDPAALSITRPSGRGNLGVLIQSVPMTAWPAGKDRPAVIVFARDSESRVQAASSVAQQLFNLTQAETALAVELANGLSLEEAAEHLGIKRNTARAHLRAIFSKTGARRQTELVRLVLNSVAALAHTPQPGGS